MKPSGLRQPKPSADESVFRFYAQLIEEVEKDSPEVSGVSLETLALWAHAIAQHYGPGSKFMDVTHSLEVALWFALHEAEQHEAQSVFGAAGDLDPENDVPGSFPIVKFKPNAGAFGWLFVFDVPIWDRSVPPPHGALVDLADAPVLFSSSPRIQAQRSCLIACDRKSSDGDISSFQEGPAIPVPAAIKPYIGRLFTSDQLFPGPTVDKWYGRLLAIPFSFRSTEVGDKALKLQQSLPVAVYETSPSSIQQAFDQLSVLSPALLWPHLNMERELEKSWLPAGFPQEQPKHILLTQPIFAMTPPLGDGLWNPLLAATDVPIVAPAGVSQDKLSDVSLSNVFVEFSPLELTAWDDVHSLGYETEFCRGAYLKRKGDQFELWMVQQRFPDGILTVSGPLRFGTVLEDSERRLRIIGQGTSLPLESAPRASKMLLLVLTTLREVSKTLLVSPKCLLTAAEQNTSFVSLQGDGPFLQDMTVEGKGHHIYVLADNHGPLRYIPGSGSRLVTIKQPMDWSAIDPDVIQRDLGSS